MQFSANKDIQAPIARVFAILSDFDAIEAGALKYNATVARLDTLTQKGVGMSWDVGFRLRDKDRALIVDITRFEAPELIEVSGVSTVFNVVARVVLTEVSAAQTRMKMVTEVTPRTLGGRLLVQSAKLARTRLNKRYEARVAQFAQEIAARVA